VLAHFTSCRKIFDVETSRQARLSRLERAKFHTLKESTHSLLPFGDRDVKEFLAPSGAKYFLKKPSGFSSKAIVFEG
jgi:hypothetical protein